MLEVYHGQRTAILVDVQNLFYSAKCLLQSKIDYSKLITGLAEDRTITRAIAYVIQRQDNSQAAFVDTLSRVGFDVVIKETKNKNKLNGEIIQSKSNYNLLLVLDAVELSNKVDSIIIASSDNEFIPLIKYLKSHGCRVSIAAFEFSHELQIAADECFYIPEEWTFIDTKFKESINPIQDFDEKQPDSNASTFEVKKNNGQK